MHATKAPKQATKQAPTPLAAMAATLGVQPTTVQLAPPAGTQLANLGNPPATPPVWASAPWAPTLPKSLVAKGNGLLGAPKGLPAALQGVHLVPGKAYKCNSAHNAAWAATATAVCAAAGPGGAPVAAVLAAGVGLHSVVAYVKRGWLVAVKQA